MRKRGIAMDTLIYAIIIIGVIVLGLVMVFTLREKGVSLIDFFKNLWRFGSG